MVSLASVKSPSIARVPRDFPGGTILCVASGPSLTQDDVDYCRGRVDAAIAVNTSYRVAPWAHALYAADAQWWQWQRGAKDFSGERYSVSTEAARWGVSILRNTGKQGLEISPDGLRTGHNSGYQSLGLAFHFGASRILLLGFDMRPGAKGQQHWHPDHPHTRTSPYAVFLDAFNTLVEPLKTAGVEVVNCTPGSALKAFPIMPLAEALP